MVMDAITIVIIIKMVRDAISIRINWKMVTLGMYCYLLELTFSVKSSCLAEQVINLPHCQGHHHHHHPYPDDLGYHLHYH